MNRSAERESFWESVYSYTFGRYTFKSSLCFRFYRSAKRVMVL
jgi:hypothetical protein